MPSLKDVRQKYQENQAQKLTITPYRYAYLGDGRGYATSNMYVPGEAGSNLLYARTTPQDTRFFPILNRNAVVPQFNLPIVIGYRQDEPRTEQVLGIHIGGLGNISASNVPLLGPHHHQHEYGGGDEVFSDGLLFKPGLVTPTSPPSMQLKVLTFVYFWDTWRQFLTTTTVDLSQFKLATSQSRYVTIALDPTTATLVYRPGPLITSSLPPPWGVTSFSFSNVPAPAGNEMPLTFVLLAGNATSLDWPTFQNDVGDARLHVQPPMLNVLDRLRQLEGYSGNEPSIATTGAGASTVDEINHRLGGLVDVNLAGVTDGQTIVYNKSQNLWLAGSAGSSNSSGNSTGAEPLFSFTQFI